MDDPVRVLSYIVPEGHRAVTVAVTTPVWAALTETNQEEAPKRIKKIIATKVCLVIFVTGKIMMFLATDCQGLFEHNLRGRGNNRNSGAMGVK